MEASQRYTACVQVVEVMEQGFSWHEAASRAGIKISQSTVYRLCQRMRQGGKQAFHEGRHAQRASPLHWDKQDWLNKPAEGVEDETGTSHQ